MDSGLFVTIGLCENMTSSTKPEEADTLSMVRGDVELLHWMSFLCFRPTVSARVLCFRTVRPPRSSVRSFVRSDRSCYHDISRAAWTISRIYSFALLMTWLYSGGQRSRSQQAVDVANASLWTLGHRSPSSKLSDKIRQLNSVNICFVFAVFIHTS